MGKLPSTVQPLGFFLTAWTHYQSQASQEPSRPPALPTCVLGSWLCPPPAESPLSTWGLFVSALHPPSTLSVDSWLLPAFVQRLGQTPILICFYSSLQTFPVLAGGIFHVVGFLVCSWWGAGFLRRTESLQPGEPQGVGRGAGWESGASGLGAFRLPPQSFPPAPPASQCFFPQKPGCSLLHQSTSLGLCTRDPPAPPGLGRHPGIVTCAHSCSGLLASTAHIPGSLWHPHLDSSCVSSRRWLERVGTLFKIQCNGETLSTLGCSQMLSSCFQVEIIHLPFKLEGVLGAPVGNPQNQRGASWLDWIGLSFMRASPVAQRVENLPAKQKMWVRFLG